MAFIGLLGLEESAFNIIIERITIVAIILIITWVVAKIFRVIMDRSYKRTSKLFKIDKTAHTFLKHFISGAIYIIGISIAVYTIPSLRTLGVSIFAGAGVLAVIIGFASQAAFSNIVSGIFISIFKPFRVGDRISVQTISGIVEDINLRHTTIRTYENIRFIIPNSRISEETIENKDLGDEKIRKFFEIGVSYDSDIDKAMKIIEEEFRKHPDYMDPPQDESFGEASDAPMVRLIAFGDSSINLRARVWTKNNAAAFRITTDVALNIKKRFDAEGIEIPFPHRTIVYKNDVLKERDQLMKKRRAKKKNSRRR